MDKIQAVYDALGLATFIFLIYKLAGFGKDKTAEMSNKETNQTKKELYHDSSIALGALESVAKVCVAGLDNSATPNVEKQDQAVKKLQSYADSKNINVSVGYLRNLVTSQVNDLRAKQGMAQQNNGNVPQTVTIHQEGENNG